MEEKPDFLQAVVYLDGPVTDMVFREACKGSCAPGPFGICGWNGMDRARGGASV